jgi:copper chaperone CopZ
MKKVVLEIPAMFGDHHVVEVRRVLSALPGVGEVYASSAFRVVEITYDADQITPDELKAQLGEAGYLDDLFVEMEVGAQGVGENGKKPFFRHSAAIAQVGNVVSFAQQMPPARRPLWPCPGVGVIEPED